MYKLRLILGVIPCNARAIGIYAPPSIPTTPAKMSTEPKKEEADKKNTEDVEVKLLKERSGAPLRSLFWLRKVKRYPRIRGTKAEAKTEPFALRRGRRDG